MGCSSSSLNDLPAVALCRRRCAFLHETIRHSHAFSAAHRSYLNSLQSIALSLQLPPPSSYSDSDSDSDHPYHNDIPFPAAAYMKHNATPSQVYEQMTTSDPHALPMAPYSSFSHTIPNNPSRYYPHQTVGGASSAYYSSASPYRPQSSPFASSSHPPSSIYSPWVSFDEDGLYSQHRTSQELKQTREQEGIPDLEDDDDNDEYEVVRPDDGAANHPKFTMHNHTDLTEASLNQTMPTASMEEVENQVHADQERFGCFGGSQRAG